MPRELRLAFTADLHWGHRPRGTEAVRLLATHLSQHPPDVLVLAGDLGTGPMFEDCLTQFADLPSHKALVPGNHDIWVGDSDAGFDSLDLYRERLPQTASRLGFHYLDAGPLYLPEADLAVVGSMNWYDYTWAIDGLREKFPDELHRLTSKRFPRGRHNDANFVRWPLDDATFTAEVVATMGRHLTEALDKVRRVVVVTHHPPFRALGFPRVGQPAGLESFLWDAFCGNRAMEELLSRHAERIAFAFCGHTHREREGNLGPIRGYNIGGDYHFKRLLTLAWPGGEVTAHPFGDST